ncbi:MAG: ABC transporter ATP-binding protein, partial [Clostridia bacterium]|nr:ABC transporter ATP-binding protein [Clostridia bacterium]
MIQLVGVKKSFVAKKTRVDALRGISYTFPERGLVFLVGRSGCGKSTLLNILGGLDAPTEGEVLFCGKSLSALSAKDLNAYRANCVGFVFQESNLFPSLTVKENILFGASQTDCTEVLKRLEIEELQDRKINELSGGQLQRVAIARALGKAHDVLRDAEPTGSLDEKTGEEIFTVLKEISKEKLVIAVTHDRERAERYGDRVLPLKDGRLEQQEEEPLITACSGASPQGEAKTIRQNNGKKVPFPYALKTGVSLVFGKKLRAIFAILFSVLSFLCFMAIFTCSSSEEAIVYEHYFSNHIEEYPYICLGCHDKPFAEMEQGLSGMDFVWYAQGQIYAKDAAQAERFSFLPQTSLIPLEEGVFYINVGPFSQANPTKPADDPLCSYYAEVVHDPITHLEYRYDSVILDGKEVAFKDSGLTIEQCVGLPVKLYSKFMTSLEQADEVPVYRFGGLVKSEWFKSYEFYSDYIKYVVGGEPSRAYVNNAIIRTQSVPNLAELFSEYKIGGSFEFFDVDGRLECFMARECRSAITSVEKVETYTGIAAGAIGLVYLILVLNVVTVSIRGNRRQVAL